MRDHNLDAEIFEMDEIESIEFLGNMETIDIVVDDTKMFFANDIYTHNSSEGEEIITGEKVSESYKKVMTSDLIISVARKMEDKMAGTARWYVIKNRYGPDGLTFPSRMDASVGKIDIFAATSIAGSEARKEMKNSHELVRKELSNRFKDFE